MHHGSTELDDTLRAFDTLGEFHQNRNKCTVFEELEMSIVDLTVANIRFTDSASRRQ